MASVLTNDDIISVKSFCFMQNQLGLNVLHYRVTETGGVPTDEIAANYFRALIGPLVIAIMADLANFQGVGVQILSPTAFPTIYDAEDPPLAGQVAGDPLPKQTCGLITKRTGFVGRAGRGRVYLPFPAESDSTILDVPSAGYIALMEDYAAALLVINTMTVGGDTAGFIPVIFGSVPGPNQAKPITSWTKRTRWATQRRRSDFGATNTTPFA